MQTKDWFEVDRQGLAMILERRGKQFVLFELLQNAWDENVRCVEVTLRRIFGTPNVELVVIDDSPEGFVDLSHAFRLFAESAKKDKAEKRGRFDLGEKLVLALCSRAEIVSTKGSVIFDADGRTTSRKKRDAGTMFRGTLRMKDEELVACHAAVRALIPPAGIQTLYNGEPLRDRASTLLASFEATLPTEIADADGYLRRTTRKTTVRVYEPFEGEEAAVYEMGIPVSTTGDRWHIDVQQKTPINLDRDSLPATYLSKLRALVLDHMAAHISVEDANGWVRDALQNQGDLVGSDAVHRVAEMRFGAKRVAFDPSDSEANHIAVSQGYQLVYGSQLNANEWDAMRRTGAILPAGRVTPSPKPYSEDGKALKLVPSDQWTPQMQAVVDYLIRISQRLIGTSVQVNIANDITWPFAATYGGRQLVLNLGRLGHKWFSGPIGPINRLVIHELGHHFSPNHLSSEFHDALCDLGGKLSQLALEEPELFAIQSSEQQSEAV